VKRAIVVSRDSRPDFDWGPWHAVWILAKHTNTVRIWSWREPLSRLVHKHASGERIEAL